MKTKALAFVLVALAISIAAGAQEKTVKTFRVRVSAEQANIREKPDIGSAILKQLPEAAVLEAEARFGEWFLVRFLDDEGIKRNGYIHESLVVVLDPAPEAERKPPKTVPPAEKPKDKDETPPAEIISSRIKAPPFIQEPPQPKTFGFTLLAGGSWAAVGDLNKGASGIMDLYGNVLGITGTGGVRGLHITYIAGGEISYSLLPYFDLVLGVDYLKGQSTSRRQYAVGEVPDILETLPKIEALPFKIGFSYHLFPFLYVKATAQYTFAKCSYLYRYEKGSYWQEWEGSARAGGLGAGLAAGGEWEFYPGVFLVGEAQFKFSKIGGFKGKSLSKNSYGESYTEDGILYAFQTQGTGESSFPVVFIRNDVPAEPGVSSARQARVDFSGLSLRTGIRIRF
jgi:hypothetical protein